MLEIWAAWLSGCCSFQAGSTAGAFLREEPSPAHHAWVWVGGVLYPTPFKQCSMWEAAQPGQTSASQAGVSEPNCLGHSFVDFL